MAPFFYAHFLSDLRLISDAYNGGIAWSMQCNEIINQYTGESKWKLPQQRIQQPLIMKFLIGL